ncbi:hypothetical protein ABIF38_008845 [Bradyrhizobium japonicum]|uniref:hypothetical protein n=1 Tax=Bradyrhizobium elkanii TaxID=29448 RepID=UPI00036CD87E|nr:hypothetical protein [Bradyrhizobium elkanii]MCP1728837.1 hypothetical protein [Bradyrhizobium elkanii]MCS3572961.1 hypothetical protein [Bradyrhizobium elkanii]MCS3594346.1 hypothetical protein [Bradyrhizobium elkanii]MCS3623789.1 hypothetical protein [Bradyrhizobium elkanii]UQD79968.1 hypothetical protein JEY66_34745 [Bradyrhizobium elkanii USDA 76]
MLQLDFRRRFLNAHCFAKRLDLYGTRLALMHSTAQDEYLQLRNIQATIIDEMQSADISVSS